MKAIGAQIREFRKKQKLSQQDLSAKVGVTMGVIYRWERGLDAPRYESLVALAGALGCRIIIDDAGGHLELKN